MSTEDWSAQARRGKKSFACRDVLLAQMHIPKPKRWYHESPNGKPGNADLCEYKLLRDGKSFSVWFDLYLVARAADGRASESFAANE